MPPKERFEDDTEVNLSDRGIDSFNKINYICMNFSYYFTLTTFYFLFSFNYDS